jgi:hypothetical protein
LALRRFGGMQFASQISVHLLESSRSALVFIAAAERCAGELLASRHAELN